ncbi:MAG: 8-amino-7-oxononanoate synthase [Nitrospirae bacterium]|nr:8-amino-7-oxononanoate synthase [Nitrospirota bacterium]
MSVFEQELAGLKAQGLFRRLRVIGSGRGPRILIEGREVVNLASNDYLGLARHPALREAASRALGTYGVGAGASRLLAGDFGLHEELEARLAAFEGRPRALLFNSGYQANVGIIPALVEKGDTLFSDELNHASLIDGCRLSRARVWVYRHRDLSHLEALLRETADARRKLIVTDGVFSMDGDLAPLPGIVALARQYGTWVMVDEAHATGVLGPRGRGTLEHFGLTDQVEVQMGTLGKALGVFGAYVTGDEGLIAYLIQRCRSFIFTTALPPALAAASIRALELVDEEPWRRERLWKNRERLVAGLRAQGFDMMGSETPIFPVRFGGVAEAHHAAARLLDLGIHAPAIRPPTVPPDACRIRLSVSAAHSEEDLEAVLLAFSRL